MAAPHSVSMPIGLAGRGLRFGPRADPCGNRRRGGTRQGGVVESRLTFRRSRRELRAVSAASRARSRTLPREIPSGPDRRAATASFPCLLVQAVRSPDRSGGFAVAASRGPAASPAASVAFRTVSPETWRYGVARIRSPARSVSIQPALPCRSVKTVPGRASSPADRGQTTVPDRTGRRTRDRRIRLFMVALHGEGFRMHAIGQAGETVRNPMGFHGASAEGTAGFVICPRGIGKNRHRPGIGFLPRGAAGCAILESVPGERTAGRLGRARWVRSNGRPSIA